MNYLKKQVRNCPAKNNTKYALLNISVRAKNNSKYALFHKAAPAPQ
jgi:hypothetical protein